MGTVRTAVGDTLRAARLKQRRTLREVSARARVSLGYLSEIERGQKEASSELLAAICDALDLQLSDVFAQVSDRLRREERFADRARQVRAAGAPVIAPPGTTGSGGAPSGGANASVRTGAAYRA